MIFRNSSLKFKIALLASAAILASVICAACTGTEPGPAVVTDGTETPAAATKPVVTVPIKGKSGSEINDRRLHAWFENGSALIHRDDFEVGDSDSVSVSMAKNEMEGFQLILASAVTHEGVRCELEALSDGAGNTLNGTVNVAYETYIKSAGKSLGMRGYVPTALLDQDDSYVGGSFDVIAGRSKTLYIRFITELDTAPGEYKGKISVVQGENVLFEGEISVNVWNITYDEATRGIHTFGYGWASQFDPNNYYYCGPTYDRDTLPKGAPDMYKYPELSEIYCDFLIDYRITPTYLPLSANGLLDEKAEKYLDNPRVNLVGLNELQQNNLAAQYARAAERGWLGKISFSQYDEPHEEWHLQTIINSINRTNRYFPTTLHFNALIRDMRKDGQNIIERLAPYTTLHCVKAQLFTGQIAETMVKFKEERGDTILWYVCGDEPVSMIDGLPSIPGTWKRILFWQEYFFNLDGFLMWQTCMWSNEDNIWEENYGEKRITPIGAGLGPTANGIFLYWHPETKMPVPTLGLEAMRDGIEDYQLIMLADEYLGRGEAMKYVERITTGHSKFTRDSAYLLEVRNDLAKAVEAALNGLK
ncbi:MAG: DUF4091 domain-containing protein [Clostridia bacterium]|nr:DUF4091 domain-containing protein [Clostridia bacterium]